MTDEVMTAKSWAFLILNKHRKGIGERNFYKLFMYVDLIINMENVPAEMREEVKKEILQALKKFS